MLVLSDAAADALALLGHRKPSATQNAILVAYRGDAGSPSYRTLTGFMSKADSLAALTSLVEGERARYADKCTRFPTISHRRERARYLALELVPPDFHHFRLFDSAGVQLAKGGEPALVDELIAAVLPPMAAMTSATREELTASVRRSAVEVYERRRADGTLGL